MRNGVLAAVWSLATRKARSKHAIDRPASDHDRLVGGVFRLALLLAVAPGLIAPALATAREFRPAITRGRHDFSPWHEGRHDHDHVPLGRNVTIGCTPADRSDPTVQAAIKELNARGPALPLGDRLRDAGLLMITFLAHGAAATSAGLALAIWIKRRRRRIAAGVVPSLLLAVLVWPIVRLFHFPDS